MIELCCEYLSIRCIWLYIFFHVMYAFQSVPRFHSCFNVKEIFAQKRRHMWSLSDSYWPNDWAVLWVFICTVHFTVCFYKVKYLLQSESPLYSSLNVKELLARNRRDIWSLSDSNRTRNHSHLVTRSHNHVVRKRTLKGLAKLAK